ncbi:hypothetical protein CSPB12327_03910 [Campylobacter sp. RM12327]|uniref:hypothetical protein n=1 Tax=Campylobacter sputorum TaxID=206 RepID=UPI0013747757|nr:MULTISPECIES: hypothetical protein [Campylobacter]ASM39992.1 hypothetical protein CSPB_0766 [Campylobacter sputorum]MBE7357643.1 hypothetical protein [Campylobacter sp. RM11302]MBF6669289.1 hypothetical protein [Campylobacter sp. RM12327]MBF6674557.1 hypothetical protein [Campylobacter sp. RM13538]MBF6676662.1 hypothetical protein [Campylobacter sp. RM12321]
MFQNILHPFVCGVLFPFICLYFVFIYLPYQIFMQKPKENNTYSFNNYKYKDIKF